VTFSIFSAIDLHHGQVVRLQYGDLERKTVFGSDPLATARQWIAAGSTWLHIVNLDGAFDESGALNWQLLPKLTGLGAQIQFGGGIRSLKHVAQALNRGVTRVIIGTAAVEDPDIVEDAVRRFGPQRIVVGIDARDGLVKTRGWQNESLISPFDLGFQVAALGIQTVIYTDIGRDGVLAGVNAHSAARLAQETGLSVIASGGVASIEDVRQTLAFHKEGVAGLIIGRALYDGKIDLQEALKLAEEI
jgi:phosphoribosylformimino-5-aminoimidazole carboxamide ribotide isomerase